MGNVTSVACCEGEGGATKHERQQGVGVTGKMGMRIVMPEHTWAQQMIGGPYPGSKFLQFTPTGVATLMALKNTMDLYMNLKVDISMDAGGEEATGWEYRTIYEVVERYKEDFAMRGVRLTFCMTSYWEWADRSDTSSSYKDIVYRSWLEFADLTKMPKNPKVPVNAYNPATDYSKGTDMIGG